MIRKLMVLYGFIIFFILGCSCKKIEKPTCQAWGKVGIEAYSAIKISSHD